MCEGILDNLKMDTKNICSIDNNLDKKTNLDLNEVKS